MNSLSYVISCKNEHFILYSWIKNLVVMETTEVPPVTKEDSGVLDKHQYSSLGDNTPTQHSPTNIEPECRYPQCMHRPPDRFIPNSDGQLNS